MQFCLIVFYLQRYSDHNVQDDYRPTNILLYTFYTPLKRNTCIDLMKCKYIVHFVVLIFAQQKGISTFFAYSLESRL